MQRCWSNRRHDHGMEKKAVATRCGPPASGGNMNRVSEGGPMKNPLEGNTSFWTPPSRTTRQNAFTEVWSARFYGKCTIVARKPAIQLVTVMLSVKALTTRYHPAETTRC